MQEPGWPRIKLLGSQESGRYPPPLHASSTRTLDFPGGAPAVRKAGAEKATASRPLVIVALALVASADFEEETSFKRDYEERAKHFVEEIEVEEESPVTVLFTDAAASHAAGAKKVEADQRAKARMQGYTGISSGECQNYTMVRNGPCEKCDTCGATSGCS
jgi:ribonucleoside-diphosphate reductase alpha chain